MILRATNSYAMMLSLIACIALMILLTGCTADDAQAGADCSQDSDCSSDAYCLNTQCAAGCTSDDDCSAGTYCELYQRHGDAEPVQACIDEVTADDGGVECESDVECREFLGDDDARCGLHQRCVLTSESPNAENAANQAANGYQDAGIMEDAAADSATPDPIEPTGRFVVIVEQLHENGPSSNGDEEESNGDEDDDEEPNSHNRRRGDANNSERNDEESTNSAQQPVSPLYLGAVVVRNENRDVVGFGYLLSVDSPTEDSTENELVEAPIVLNEEGSCLKEPEQAPYASLGGPGGRAFIELVDGSFDPIALEQHWRLQIVANGPECPIGPADDDVDETDSNEYIGKYRVFVCETESDTPMPETDACDDRFAGPFSNFTDLEVTFDE